MFQTAAGAGGGRDKIPDSSDNFLLQQTTNWIYNIYIVTGKMYF